MSQLKLYYYCLALYLLFVPANLLWAESLARLSSGSMTVELATSQHEKFTLQLELDEDLKIDNKMEVFFIENPPRLVIDIPAVKITSAREALIDHPQLERLRLGVHPDKIRLVLDIMEGYFPVYEILPSKDQSKAKVQFELSSSQVFEQVKNVIPVNKEETVETITEEIVQEESTQVEPAKEEVLIEDDFESDEMQEEVKEVKTDLEERLRALALDETAEELKVDLAQQDSQQIEEQNPAAVEERVVQGILFEAKPTEQRYAIIIKVKGFDEYSLSRRDDSRYELILKNCRLAGKYLLLPFFPPKEFTGLQVVSGAETSTGVNFSFHIEAGTRLVPHRTEEGIIVNVMP